MKYAVIENKAISCPRYKNESNGKNPPKKKELLATIPVGVESCVSTQKCNCYESVCVVNRIVVEYFYIYLCSELLSTHCLYQSLFPRELFYFHVRACECE